MNKLVKAARAMSRPNMPGPFVPHNGSWPLAVAMNAFKAEGDIGTGLDLLAPGVLAVWTAYATHCYCTMEIVGYYEDSFADGYVADFEGVLHATIAEYNAMHQFPVHCTYVLPIIDNGIVYKFNDVWVVVAVGDEAPNCYMVIEVTNVEPMGDGS